MEHFGGVFKLDLTEETRTQLQEETPLLASCWLRLYVVNKAAASQWLPGHIKNVTVGATNKNVIVISYCFVVTCAKNIRSALISNIRKSAPRNKLLAVIAFLSLRVYTPVVSGYSWSVEFVKSTPYINAAIVSRWLAPIIWHNTAL